MPDIVEFYTDFEEWDRMLADLEEMITARPEVFAPEDMDITKEPNYKNPNSQTSSLKNSRSYLQPLDRNKIIN